MGKPAPPLTASQVAYLDAFTDHLYARGDEERQATRAQMDQALGVILDTAGITVRARTVDHTHDLVDVLVRAMSYRTLETT